MTADAQARYRARNPETIREAAARYRANRRARAEALEAADHAAQLEATYAALAPVALLLESRARALALPAAGRGAVALEARARRAEVLDLYAAITREVTA
ncbi:hypothetical protein ACTXLB_02395 [Brachybacterium tyrofermentans]|uniref:hypothetical protein n=1 Tax=Brachybacterium tyrofermentans TaxID=47848 RepID=UPI003FCF5466